MSVAGVPQNGQPRAILLSFMLFPPKRKGRPQRVSGLNLFVVLQFENKSDGAVVKTRKARANLSFPVHIVECVREVYPAGCREPVRCRDDVIKTVSKSLETSVVHITHAPPAVTGMRFARPVITKQF